MLPPDQDEYQDPDDTDPEEGTEPENLLPLPASGRGSLSYWKTEVQAGAERVKLFLANWNGNLDSYRAQSLTKLPDHDTITVPRDFENVEQKGSQLFFQVPDVHLTARQRDAAGNVQLFQSVLNYYLSDDETNALAVMNEVLFDALCPAGLMCSVLGYEAFKEGPDVRMEVGTREVAPAQPLPGAILGLSGAETPPQTEPIHQMVPNIVHSRYFWSRLSPAQIVLPALFKGSVYDKAPWQGYRFEEDWEVLKTRHNLGQMDKPAAGNTEDLYLSGEPGLTNSTKSSDKVTGVCLWYRTALYDPAATGHPEKMRELIYLDGLDEPLVHRDSPHQKDGPSGELLGLIGFPTHLGALRYVSDSAFPPSECTIGRAQVDELSKSRTQMVLQRERSIPMRLADTSRLGGEAGLAKFKKNIFQGIIPLDNLDPNNPPIVAVGLASYPRENFAFHEYVDRDLQGVWAMGDNQRGQSSAEKKTATEQSIVEKSASARLDKERRQALKYFIQGVRKLGALIQLYGTEQEYFQILGPNKAKELAQFNLQGIQGKFTYWARPDSAIRLDQSEAKQQALKLYEMLAKDPNVNRVELLYEICLQWNLDPSTVVVPQLPAKGPDPANVSFRFSAIDIDPRNANFPLIIEILRQSGYKIDPGLVSQVQGIAQQQSQILNMAGGIQGGVPAPSAPGAPPSPGPVQTDHGGTAPLADHLNKHRAEETGNRPGRPPMVQ